MLAKFRKDLVVERHLVAADRAPVGRIEGENDRLARQISEGEILIGRDAQRESRCACSCGQNVCHFFPLLMLPPSEKTGSLARESMHLTRIILRVRRSSDDASYDLPRPFALTAVKFLSAR